jgi:hypothetical protein
MLMMNFPDPNVVLSIHISKGKEESRGEKGLFAVNRVRYTRRDKSRCNVDNLERTQVVGNFGKCANRMVFRSKRTL